MFSCSKSFRGSHWFGSFCKVRPPSENFRSTTDSPHPGRKKKKHIMPEAHPHPQDNIWTLSLHWFSQLALVSANFTSYCLLFLSSCFGHIEFAVSHTLSAVSCSCALLMLFLCLECPPQFQPPDRFLFFLVLSGSITSSAVFTMPGRHRQSHFPHFVLKPPVQCFIVL